MNYSPPALPPAPAAPVAPPPARPVPPEAPEAATRPLVVFAALGAPLADDLDQPPAPARRGAAPQGDGGEPSRPAEGGGAPLTPVLGAGGGAAAGGAASAAQSQDQALRQAMASGVGQVSNLPSSAPPAGAATVAQVPGSGSPGPTLATPGRQVGNLPHGGVPTAGGQAGGAPQGGGAPVGALGLTPLTSGLLAVGPDAGALPLVKAYDPQTQSLKFQFLAGPVTFHGGVRVAIADVTGDGTPDVIAAAGPGGGNRVRVVDGSTGLPLLGTLGNFQAFTAAQSDGVFVAAADVDGDGHADIVAGTEAGGAGLLRVFSGADGSLLRTLSLGAEAQQFGVRAAAGDVNGDGKADLVTGNGPGGLSRVCVFDGATAKEFYDFFALDAAYRGGVYLAAGDLSGDGKADILVGAASGTPWLRVFSGADTTPLGTARVFAPSFTGGVRVGVVDADGDGRLDVAVGQGPSGGSVRLLDGRTLAPLGSFAPFGQGFDSGLFVAGASPVGAVSPLVILPEVTITASKPDTLEGSSSTGEFTVSRTGSTSQGLTVSVSASGTASATSDYSSGITTGSVAIPVGASSVTVSVTAVTDGKQEGPETVVCTIQPDARAYTVGNPSVAVVRIADVDAPPPFVPEAECGCSACDLTGQASGLSGGFPESSPEGLRYADGLGGTRDNDMASSGFGQGWGFTRGWSNDPGVTKTVFGGNATVDCQLPFLQKDSSGIVVAVASDRAARYFDPSGSSYLPRHFLTEVLSYNSGTGEYTLSDSTGGQQVFYDFSTSLPASQRGGLKSYRDAGGNTTSITWSGGKPSEVTRSVTVGSTTTTESYLYSYLSSGANSGRLASVTLRRQVNGGSWSTVRVAEYGYYDGTTSLGTLGDLKTAVLKDGSGSTLDTQYYRYYTSSSSTGYAGALKYKFGAESYGRLLAAYSSPDSATDAQVAPYADLYQEYDGVQRVTKQVVQGAGCSVCTGGLGTFTLSYTTSAFADGYNSWRSKTVETLPDGNQRIEYSNFAGQVMLDVFLDTTTSTTWATAYQYDGSGRLVLTAQPSAVTGYDEARPDLLNNQAGNYQYLSDSSGLIGTYTSATSTTATSSTAGDVAGYLKQTDLKRGESGTAIPQTAMQYVSRSAGSQTIDVPASSTVYRNTNGTGGETTSYGYTWQGSTLEVASLTTSLPVVSSSQNGPGTADSDTTVNDQYGRPIWRKDADGFISYAEYDQATGAVVKSIVDVDTTQTSDFSNLPSGWSTPTGGGLHLKTTFEVDSLGRVTKETNPNGEVSYTVYNDTNHEVRVYRGWDTTGNTATGPTEVYREDRAGGYSETLTMSATPTVSGGRPTGAESIGSLQTLSRRYTNAAGQLDHEDLYFDLSGLTYTTSSSLGTENTNFYRTRYSYEQHGLNNRVQLPTGTIQRIVYDGQGRRLSEWVGTDDTGATNSDPTGGGATGNNMTKVRDYQYDAGGVGDSNLTQTTEYPGGSAANRVSTNWFDWRDRLVATKGGVQTSESTDTQRPLFYTELDNLGEAVAQEQYDGDNVTLSDGNGDGVPDKPSSSLLRARTVSSFDDQRRDYREQVYSVNQSTGAISTYALTTDRFFDHRGEVIKTSEPGGLVTKSAFDGANREVKRYTTDGGGDSGWSDAGNVTGDAVLLQVETTFDKVGSAILQVTRERFHDETGTGALGDVSTTPKARVSYVGMWYDLADRLTDSADVGTNGGSAWTRPTSAPSRSDTVLVTTEAHNAAGWLETITDPRGLVSKRYYDNLGRTTKAIEGYVDGAVSDGDDHTVEYTYDGDDHTLTLKVDLPSSAYQTTQWVYGVSTSGGSDLASNDVLAAVRYPDKSTGSASSSEQESCTVNRLGEAKTFTDRNGTTHTYTRDVLGRLTADAVTTLGSGVDGSVRRLETAFDTGGRAYLFTSYDAASGGNIVNQVQDGFNGLGQLTNQWQSHSGAVNTSTTPQVQYTYTEMSGGANHSRLTSIVYPNGRVISYNYASGLDSAISRLTSLSDTSGTLESLLYLGLDTVVQRTHPLSGVDETFIKLASESVGDAGDKYTGRDRFGRVAAARWLLASSGVALDYFKYGYDRDSNVLFRDNLVNSAFGELYHANGASGGYDLTNQLTDFRRGTLSDSNSDGVADTVSTASRTQGWNIDAAGNFNSVTTDGTTQTRTANRQNQITSISGLTTPSYDGNGNTTGDEQGNTLIDDAWNRLVAVKQGTTTLVAYTLDALGRRATENAGTQRDLYYSAQWQVIEERESGVVRVQSVFSPVYIDALVLRDRDADGLSGNGLEERLWVQQDANWSVTALTDSAGSVLERYLYDPYGVPGLLTGSWGNRTTSLYAWISLQQGGRYHAGSGLYNFRHRDQSPSLGRWVVPDPIGLRGGDLNLYRYVGNSPLTYRDPTGLERPIHLPSGRPGWWNELPEYPPLKLQVTLDGTIVDSKNGGIQPVWTNKPLRLVWTIYGEKGCERAIPGVQAGFRDVAEEARP